MSLDLFVFDGVDLPDNADAIAALLDEGCPGGTRLTPALAALVAHLELRFPGGDGVGGDSPWAAWPLDEPRVGGRAVGLSIMWTADEVVLDEVVEQCRTRGLTLYDPQTFTITRLRPPPDARRLWWQRRSR